MATPVVSFETSPSVLVESEETVLTFTFQLSEAPPAGGVTVTVNGNAPQILNHFDLDNGANIEFTGGDFPMPNNLFTGFDFNITSQTATISMPIFDDDDTDPEFNGVRNFIFTLEPGQGYTVDPSASQDSVTLRDDPAPVVNNPPVANDDSGSTLENQILNGNVIGNDSDPDGDSLTISALNGNASIGTQVTLNSGALLTLNSNGSYAYNPNGQFNYLIDGQTTGDSFSYTISDGRGGTDTAIVTITINGVSDVVTPPPPPPVDLDPAQYGASHPDLIVGIGYDLAALTNHYLTSGQAEGRSKDLFDEFRYLASNPDLIPVFGSNGAAATEHYIRSGYSENRPLASFEPSQYLASNGDLITAFGYNPTQATNHYVSSGYNEGRAADSFNESRYLASNPDLITAFGYNPQAATDHYIRNGFQEGRNPNIFNPDIYIASHTDLVQAIQYNLQAGTDHYILNGAAEGRATNAFNPVAYLDRYADLQNVFGNDLTAATRHYIENGFEEGRTWM
jgi:VCBS repeat-containing protein